jgi:DNA excision repair protein ERCC-2
MATRFDPDHKTLKLAVADLLDAQLLRSLGFANRGGYERMWLGQAIHSRYQEQAIEEDPTYRREVTIEHTFEHHGFQVTVHGRADGLRRDEDGVLVVEEIKSVRRGATLSPTVRELYDRQAALYAWMLMEKGEEEKVLADLILIAIGSDEVERLPVVVERQELTASVKRRVNALLRIQRSEQKSRKQRHSTASELAFPYPDQRLGQQDITDVVAAALEASEHVLLEAPTGIGKTVASLYPALKYALAHDKRIFVLTAKTLQQEMAIQVLDLLNQDESFRSLRLRAKAKMCANDQVLCHEEYCNFARDYYLKVQQTGVTHAIFKRYPTLLPDTIFAHARSAEVCPFEVSLELAGRSQVTVCDYNYAFDPYVALQDFSADADLGNTILIVDEIHNLVSRGRGYYSPHLSSRKARRAGDSAAHGAAEIHSQIAGLCYRLENLIIDHVDELQPATGQKEWAFEEALPEEDLWRLRPQLDRAFVEYLEYRRETKTLVADDLFVELYFEFLRFLNAVMLSDTGSGGMTAFSHYMERRGDEYLFCILCKDPSRFLGEVINRCHSVVGLSATLSPYEFYRDLLGFETARTISFRSANPFPVENRQVVIDSTVETTWRERPANVPRIAERLTAFADAVPGNCLVLFPSYAFLADVAAHTRPQKKRVLVQNRGDGDAQREEILETLRGAVLGDVLLLAVAGGVFAEGVDYPGKMLQAVAIVGPCLPAVTLEAQLLRIYYDERFERGFEYAFIVPGMTRVVQAAGRLIRSAEDTGIIALFDRRFTRRPYKEYLPPDWLGEGKVGDLVGDPEEVARIFFVEPATKALQ